MVYAESAVNLTLTGTRLDESTPISLEEGWNLVPFLSRTTVPVEEAVASVNGALVLIKDSEGQVYFPLYGIDTLGSLKPGEGYLVYLNEAAVLVYPATDDTVRAGVQEAPIVNSTRPDNEGSRVIDPRR